MYVFYARALNLTFQTKMVEGNKEQAFKHNSSETLLDLLADVWTNHMKRSSGSSFTDSLSIAVFDIHPNSLASLCKLAIFHFFFIQFSTS